MSNSSEFAYRINGTTYFWSPTGLNEYLNLLSNLNENGELPITPWWEEDWEGLAECEAGEVDDDPHGFRDMDPNS